MDTPQVTPWQITTLLSIAANFGQLLLGWRKTRSEAGRVDVDVDKVRQDLVVELIDKSRELRDEIEAQNEKRIVFLKTRLKEAEEESKALKAGVAELEQAIADSEKARREAEAETVFLIDTLEESVRELGTAFEVERHRRRALEDELREWKASGQSLGRGLDSED